MTFTATFHFHDRLNVFLPRRQRHHAVNHAFTWRASIKDMIESLGVPHPEIALIVINDQAVAFNAIVNDGDVIHVYPDYEAAITLGAKIRLTPPYPGRPRFVLDTHLGRLASYLRMMGFDTLYRNDYPDDELARVSHDETRILLTRDVGLLKRNLVIYGYYVRNTHPKLRLTEINERFQLSEQAIPFQFCMKCNGALHRVDKHAVQDIISERTATHYDEFHQCGSCQRVYWKGSHYQKMRTLLQELFVL